MATELKKIPELDVRSEEGKVHTSLIPSFDTTDASDKAINDLFKELLEFHPEIQQFVPSNSTWDQLSGGQGPSGPDAIVISENTSATPVYFQRKIAGALADYQSSQYPQSNVLRQHHNHMVYIHVSSPSRIPIEDPRDDDKSKFDALTKQWKEEEAFTSSPTIIAMNFAYQQTIGMGERALPYILEDLERNSSEWFWALQAITGEDPVREEDRGYTDRMRDSWLEWAKENGIVW